MGSQHWLIVGMPSNRVLAIAVEVSQNSVELPQIWGEQQQSLPRYDEVSTHPDASVGVELQRQLCDGRRKGLWFQHDPTVAVRHVAIPC